MLIIFFSLLRSIYAMNFAPKIGNQTKMAKKNGLSYFTIVKVKWLKKREREAGNERAKDGFISNGVPASQPARMENDTVPTQKQRKSLLIELNVGRTNIVATKFSN